MEWGGKYRIRNLEEKFLFSMGKLPTNENPISQTDDVGVFGSKLSEEYALVAKHFHLDRNAICELARSGIETIFGGEEDRERLRRIMWRG